MQLWLRFECESYPDDGEEAAFYARYSSIRKPITKKVPTPTQGRNKNVIAETARYCLRLHNNRSDPLLGVAGAEKKKTIPQSGKTLANPGKPGKQRSWPLEDDVVVLLVFIRLELFCKKCPDRLILAAICNP